MRNPQKGPVSLALVYGVSQIIPFYIDYKDQNSNKGVNAGDGTGPSQQHGSGPQSGTQSDKDKAGSLEGGLSDLLFRNGFATHLGISVMF